MDYIFKKLLGEPSHYGFQIIDSRLLMDLRTKNPKAIFNFLNFRETLVHAGIRAWKRKKTLIKEREYLLIILVLVFNISISYIYIYTRARWVFRFWDGFGVF
jgi:hypothetical protein